MCEKSRMILHFQVHPANEYQQVEKGGYLDLCPESKCQTVAPPSTAARFLYQVQNPPCPPLEKGDSLVACNEFPPFLKGGRGGF